MSQGNKKNHKIKDMIGVKFGNGCKVIKLIGMINKYLRWLCVCKCGEQFISDGFSIRRGRIISCKECSKKRFSKKMSYDLTNYEWNGLKVINRVNKEKHIKNYGTRWLVRCSCGKEFVVSQLRINGSKSIKSCKECGNKNKSKKLIKNITGLIFGQNSKVLKLLDTYRGKNVEYLCLCGVCGKEFISTRLTILGKKYKTYGCPQCSHKLSAKKGKENSRWNLNLTDEERKIRRCYPEYTKWIKKIYERDNYTCQICNQHGYILNSHHLEGYNHSIKGRLEVNNGITLCKKCHKNFHKIYGKGNNTLRQFIEWSDEQ